MSGGKGSVLKSYFAVLMLTYQSAEGDGAIAVHAAAEWFEGIIKTDETSDVVSRHPDHVRPHNMWGCSNAQAYNNRYAILGGDWSPFWHDLIDLVGMEELYIKMYTAPDFVDAILRHLVDYYFQVSKRIFDAAADVIDIFFIGNDFGSQIGPLMSPEMFGRFMAPHLKRLCDLGHSLRLILCRATWV